MKTFESIEKKYNENYKESITGKTFLVAIVRRYILAILIFLISVVLAFITSRYLITKTYESSINIEKKNAFNADQHQLVLTTATEKNNVITIANNLKIKNIKHANSKEITTEEIYSGTSIKSLVSGSKYVTLSFESSDTSITKYVIAEIANVTATSLVKSGKSDFSSVVVSSDATEPVKNSNENLYFLIIIIGGLIVSLAVPLAVEILSDRVYDKRDIEELGGQSFEISII